LWKQDAQRRATDLPDGASQTFARQGVRSLNPFETADENSRYAQASLGTFLAALKPIATAMLCRTIRRGVIRPWTKRQ
jgi:hypothetical protein